MSLDRLEVLLDERKQELRQLGLRVRELRRLQGLTTRELAERANVSASTVSQIETGTTSPSVVSLRRIAAGLGVPLAEFFLDGRVGGSPSASSRDARLTGATSGSRRGVVEIVRRDQRKRLQFPGSHMYELLTPNLRWDIEFLLVELEAGHPPVESMAHPGQECALVLAGTMHVIVGNEEYVLEAGDSVALDSSIPHRIENRGAEKVVQISAITPPRL
jgi:transcriptional regulator with XRE-family HTH domain